MNIDEKTLYQLLITNVRYSIGRDNHLAPGNSNRIIKECFPMLSDEFKVQLKEKLISEIKFELGFKKREFEADWLDLIEYLEQQ
jgi:hypothetical protein